jgi:hypothetical protein
MKKNKLSRYLQFINESIDDSTVDLLLERANNTG